MLFFDLFDCILLKHLINKNSYRKVKKAVVLISLAILHVVLWTSCSGCMSDFGNGSDIVHIDSSSNVIFNTYKAIDDNGWAKTDTIEFNLPLVDSGTDLDVTISVRYTNRYPYQNLQIYAFLAEQDTSNIINSLPLHQNDLVIDSLIHLEDSLNLEKTKIENHINNKETERDSLLKINRDSVLKAEQADSLRKDSVRKAAEKAKEKAYAALSQSAKDSLHLDSLRQDSLLRLTKHEQDSIAAVQQQMIADSIRNAINSLTRTIDFILFNNKDKKSGNGMMFIEANADCGTIHLKGNTRYKIIIYHNMKDYLLKGISDVGITLKRSTSAKPLNKKTRWF